MGLIGKTPRNLTLSAAGRFTIQPAQTMTSATGLSPARRNGAVHRGQEFSQASNLANYSPSPSRQSVSPGRFSVQPAAKRSDPSTSAPDKNGVKRPRTNEFEEDESPLAEFAAEFIAERRAAGKKGRQLAVPGMQARNIRLGRNGGIGGHVVYEEIHTVLSAALVNTRLGMSELQY